MGVIEELEAATRSVAEKAGPAVVGVGRGWGGCGVVIADGQVLTNAHNLRGAEATVRFADGRKATGQVNGIDLDGDLAVLAVDTAGASPVEWAETSVGEDGPGSVVFALARSRDAGLRVTFGQVTAVGQAFRGPGGRRIKGSLEHSAPLAKGSSGGPVVDASGRLVGINTNRLGEGFYQAIPADADLRARVEGLSRGESVRRPHLGVALVPGRAARQLRQAVGLPARDGLLVRGVEQDSPADRAGLVAGDLLVSAEGRPLARIDDLHEVLASAAPDAALAFSVVRGVEELEVTVVMGGDGARVEGSA